MLIATHGVLDNGIWLDTLSDLAASVLKKGMEHLKGFLGETRLFDSPSNPLQFRALCLVFHDDFGFPNVNEREEVVCVQQHTAAIGHDHINHTIQRLRMKSCTPLSI